MSAEAKEKMQQQYERWLARTDGELKQELIGIAGKEKEIEDRFFKELSFGTGGLRGVIGAGCNRMNIFTVGKATQGLAQYLNAQFERPSVAIAYDSRKNSDLFARTAATVLAANGVKVHLFAELMPTPMLSFAVRALQCSGGIVVTASHNPAQYNGYKVYGADGCQITLAAAERITQEIARADVFDGVRTGDFDALLAQGKICYVPQQVTDAFDEAVLACRMQPEREGTLKVVYAPLNGTGNKPVRRVLQRMGMRDVTVVTQQELPDSEFPTCPYPNPEEKEALRLGLETCRACGGQLLLATDPDCDRVGCAVLHEGEYHLINGNQMGVLLLEYVCRMRTQNGNMPERAVAVKTIVTTELAQAIASAYQVTLENTLTGFKFIGEYIGALEQQGEKQRFIFGFEESYGYLSGTHARDKDAVNAAVLICEMAEDYRRQGMTLMDALQAIYARYGYYHEVLESFAFEGADGMARMNEMMKNLRRNPPQKLGGDAVASVSDYWAGTRTQGAHMERLALPQSDVMGFALASGGSVVVRPSGTEPKIKIYYSLRGEGERQAAACMREISRDVHEILGV